MNYQESLAYLEELAVFGIRQGLERIEKLLAYLGNPQEKFRAIHVTGTNGKGSVCALLSAVLRQANIPAGLYISPHLSSYTERIQISGKNIEEQEFAELATEIRAYVEKMCAEGEECPTQFEFLTAMAFLAFAKRKVEYAVVEVGLGGLLDSTNVISPEISVVTNVTMDHADFCGGDLAGIARQKAGIIKAEIPVVTAATGEALEILRAEAEKKNADIFVFGEDFEITSCKGTALDEQGLQRIAFHSSILGIAEERYALRLLGRHQLQNAAVALMAASLLAHQEKRITEDALEEALRATSWPGRFERMKVGAQDVLIDGAHNADGMRALRESLDFYYGDRQRVLLLGMLKDKDAAGMLGALLRQDDIVVLVSPDSARAQKPEMLLSTVNRYALQAESASSRAAGLQRAFDLAGEEKLLVVAGSLYLIGEIRDLLLVRKRTLEV